MIICSIQFSAVHGKYTNCFITKDKKMYLSLMCPFSGQRTLDKKCYLCVFGDIYLQLD